MSLAQNTTKDNAIDIRREFFFAHTHPLLEEESQCLLNIIIFLNFINFARSTYTISYSKLPQTHAHSVEIIIQKKSSQRMRL